MVSKMEERILIVEDARMFSRILKSRLEERGIHVTVAESMQEAEDITGENPELFFLAILDLNLPDAPNGEVVDYILSLNIPSIVFTGQFSDETREMIIEKNVVDYVIKDDPSSIDYVIGLVMRLQQNRNITVLAVDDSKTARSILVSLLRLQQYKVLEAENGLQALEILAEHADIKVVLTDYMMPEMDGFELTKTIRRKYSRNEMAIIGISAHGGSNLSARFMKFGASDFITKPFSVEEFQCRINQNVELISHIHALNEAVIRDFLTGLHNRRFFFDRGEKIFRASSKKNRPMAIAMLDIDHFKRINDTYGHDAGDITLVKLAELLLQYEHDVDIISRTGGEEFCLMVTNMNRIELISFFENLRNDIEDLVIDFGGITISITASIGVCCTQLDSLDAMIANADEKLYESKDGGRNKVTFS